MSGTTDILTLAVVGGVMYYVLIANPSFLDNIVSKIVPKSSAAPAAPAAAPATGGSTAAAAAPSGSGSGCNSGAPDCSCTAAAGGGNSPGWYTAGANASSGSGWGGAPGHHHCDWRAKCCFCTDVPKCIKSGTPPQKPGSCRPDWGTAGYVQKGGPYPATANFRQCPSGTGPPGENV